jgi:hypothetical protein
MTLAGVRCPKDKRGKQMEFDINTLIPIGTFVIGTAWMLLVVFVEHLATSE